MKLKRIVAGRYQSEDGRVLIERVVSQQTYRANEVCWSSTINGKQQALNYNTLREASEAADKKETLPQL